ncbi:hypothetical protein HYH03_013574 [Edaphochlamys debaryana]|uniref:Uncharacterized protein n=1 Tax=Edaphochlamys debaryana TaxID=47281 RepID=A0A836BUD6_9CHLO|nr:hypothetical protein HYH03_013574 [Edaphochlamys debaryana]|eukprot:KAG2487858.1 hypothetical protein HYH03_013574 [Edaphochlamys debaryana]
MSSVKTLNANAEVMNRAAALFMNINAAKGLMDVMRSNYGPKGTIKMLVSGAGDIKLTKDGNVLLREMQIQNPTAVMIARAAVAQDDITGDGTTSIVLLIGELMRGAERYLSEGTHPRVLVEGFEAARKACLEFLDAFKLPLPVPAPVEGADASAPPPVDRELIRCVARTSLRTKLAEPLADRLTDIVTDAVLTIRRTGQPIDLYMVEVMHMRHKLDSDTRLVRGLVLDHGSRHPDMPKRLDNAFILSCNISLEYEKSEVNSGFFYSSADQREKLVAAERAYTDERVRKIIELKKKVCASPDQGFVVINQKGIDPLSLDALAKEGIIALRRAKKRNMERIQLACGGFCANSVEELSPDCLGHADEVYEHVLGEEKYTFVEGVKNATSCTILIKGPSDHVIAQIKDAVRDGLRAVKNCIEDGAVIPGAGAFEVAAAHHLKSVIRPKISGRAKLGIDAFADALLGLVKALAENSGHDPQEAVIRLSEEAERGLVVGFDTATGEPMDPTTAGVYDNYLVKRQILQSAPVLAGQLLLVDEVMRAGINMRKQ